MYNWKIPKLPEIDYLKRACTKIHYFGLGFIQVKTGEHERYHFYTPFLPQIKEGVHNHRYGFESRILSGSLKNYIYNPEAGDTHVKYKVSCDPNNPITAIHQNCHLGSPLVVNHYNRGSTYSMSHNTFHRVASPIGCITVLSLGVVMKKFAQVIEKVGKDRECPFSNPMDPDTLWEIVDKMLKEG